MSWDYDRKRHTLEVPTTELIRALSHRSDPGIAFRIFRSVTIIFFTVTILSTVAVVGWLKTLGVFDDQTHLLTSITAYHPSDNSVVFDRDGRKIGEYFDEYHVFVPYAELPPLLLKAIVAIEDRNFFSHEGIDLKGIVRAAISSLRGGEYRQGASTLTQQLVRNFLLSREKTINRKIREIALSVQLERILPKEKILETYCNSMFLGNGSYGVGAAAQRYFGRTLSELQPHELALLAGLFQSPSRFNPKRSPELAKRRQKLVIQAMYRSRFISREQALTMINAPLNYADYTPVNASVAPYFIDYVRDSVDQLLATGGVKNRGLRIYTTLDTNMQNLAQLTIQESAEHLTRVESWINRPLKWRKPMTSDEKPPGIEVAMLSVDPQSGEILTMIGGRDYNQSQFNRAVSAMRSPGSGFKPVVYSLAIDNGYKWSDMFYVSPISINGYRPKNYEDEFFTETTLIRAFYRSMNTVAVEIGTKLGLPTILEHARKMGVKSTLKEEPATILGSSEVNLLDMARVYSTFANKGKMVETTAIRRIESRSGEVLYEAPAVQDRTTQAISEQLAYVMTDAMRSVFRHGTAAYFAEMSNFSAGKTGTSNDSVDNWFNGFSSNLTTIVWVGTDDQSPMKKPASGATAALPIWHSFTQKAQALRKPEPFRVPGGITAIRIDPRLGTRSGSGVLAYFLRGKEPARFTSDLQESASGSGVRRDLFSH
jgi:penicillin-binding protein 1A